MIRKTKKKNFNAILHVKVSADMLEDLHLMAESTGFTYSQFVRLILSQFLKDYGPQRADNGMK